MSKPKNFFFNQKEIQDGNISSNGDSSSNSSMNKSEASIPSLGQSESGFSSVSQLDSSMQQFEGYKVSMRKQRRSRHKRLEMRANNFF